MSNVFHPVTESFRNMLAACTANSDGVLIFPSEPPIVLHVRIGESGAWSVGTSATGAYAITEATRAEVAGAVKIETDGTYVRAVDLAARALYATDAGAALPDDPPPPPPPH